MSATRPAQIASSDDDIRWSRQFRAGRVVRLGGPVALVTGSVLTALGMAFHLPPGMPEDVTLAIAIAEDQWWLISHLLLGFGLAIVAIGAATAVRLAHGRGAILITVGAVSTSLGAVLMSLSDMAHGAVGFALAGQVDPATSFEIHQAYFQHPAILGLNAGALLLTVGMLVLGTGMLRSRDLPRWIGAVILLTPIAVQVGFNLQFPTYLHGVPFVVGMTVLAYAITSTQPDSTQGVRFTS